MHRGYRHETPLQMAQRHLIEAEQRLRRQERRVAELERAGFDDMLPTSSRLLETMRDFSRLAREHLRVERVEAARSGWLPR